MRPISFMLLALLVGVVSCENTVGERYEDFLGRAEGARVPPEVVEATGGVFRELSGDYLWNIYLRPLGTVYLDLRATFLTWEPIDDTHANVTGELRLAEAAPDSVSLADFSAVMDEHGHMLILVGNCEDVTDPACPVHVPPELSPIEDTAVDTMFYLDLTVFEDGSVCGAIAEYDEEGNDIRDRSVVTQPLQLGLGGSTFGGLPYLSDGTAPTEVPTQCAAEVSVGEGDTGLEDTSSDADEDTDDVEEEVLTAPPLDYTGVRADLSGRYYMNVKAAGSLDVAFIADLVYYEDGSFASVDGALRSLENSTAAPALAVFSSDVDENGQFEVVIEDLQTESAVGHIVADIALTAAIVDADTICGVGDGEVYEPLSLPLAGTTFGAIRIADDAFEAPEEILSACP